MAASCGVRQGSSYRTLHLRRVLPHCHYEMNKRCSYGRALVCSMATPLRRAKCGVRRECVRSAAEISVVWGTGETSVLSLFYVASGEGPRSHTSRGPGRNFDIYGVS